MSRTTALAFALLAAASAAARAADEAGPAAAVDLRSLLHAAWDRGSARMTLAGGPLPEMFRRFHRAHGALVADVRLVERFREPRCARYEIAFVQRGADAGDGARIDADSLRLELNYCLDGSAPASGMDIDLLGELLRGRERQRSAADAQ